MLTRAKPRDHQRINSEVEREDNRPKHELDPARQAGRVERGEQVVLDESAAVSGFPAAGAGPVLQGSEWADPARELDEDAPDRGRDMDPREPRVAQHQETAQNDECDEREMDD